MSKSRLVIATVALLTVGLTTPTAPAQAAGVSSKDVPTAAQVRAKIGGLKGGSSELRNNAAFTFPGKKCGRWRTARGTSGTARSLHKGNTYATVQVVRLKSPKAARTVIRSYARHVKRCEKYRLGSYTYRVAKRNLPKVGAARVGYRRKVSSTHATFAIIRKGQRVALVSVARSGREQPMKPFRKLVRIAAKRMA